MAAGVFARHETFHPRYGWLKKGFDAANEDATVFLRKDAHVLLGVGKNMARAIRYWCHAFKLLEDEPIAGGRKRASHPTDFGEFLLGADGVDPYLEDVGSLWLLHWNLLKDPCQATAWRYAFLTHARPEVSVEDLTKALVDHVGAHFPQSRVVEASLKKDATCIIRMYGRQPSAHMVGEESIHCPFAELGLLRGLEERKRYEFRVGRKPGLSHLLIAAISLDYADMTAGDARTVSLSRLLRGAGSPGLALKLGESDLYAALEQAAEADEALRLSEAAGIIQLTFTECPAELARRLVLKHYAESLSRRAVA